MMEIRSAASAQTHDPGFFVGLEDVPPAFGLVLVTGGIRAGGALSGWGAAVDAGAFPAAPLMILETFWPTALPALFPMSLRKLLNCEEADSVASHHPVWAQSTRDNVRPA
jgi:hypothetical protein